MQVVALRDIVEIKGGGTPSRSIPAFWNGDIPWATVKDITSIELRETQEAITELGVSNSAATLISAGTIIVPTRMAVGRVAMATIELAINQDLKALISKPTVDKRYLLRALMAKSSELERKASGATVKGITLEALGDLPIRLPSLEEQRRIALILDRADELRRKRGVGLEKLNALPQAIFRQMFGDVLTNSKNWNTGRTLGEYAVIASGITKGRKLSGAAVIRSVAYVTVVNVQDRALNLNVVKTIEATENEINRYRLKRDDLLLTEGGDPDKLGRGTLWNEELPECIHQNHIFRVRLVSDEINPVFLNWLVGSERGKEYFMRCAKQTTGIASINMTQLRAFPLIVPPKQIQDEFASRIAAITPLRAAALISKSQLDQLYASLQHRAFSDTLSFSGAAETLGSPLRENSAPPLAV